MDNATQTKTAQYQRLGTRLAWTFTVLTTIAIVVTSGLLFLNFRNQLRQDVRQRLLNIVSIVALQQDGDLHARLVNPEDAQSQVYQMFAAHSTEILKTEPELVFLFTARQNESGAIYFVLDISPDPAYERSSIGDIYEEPSELLVANFATLDRPIVETDFYTDEFGTFLSAYAPFYRSDGTREGIVGVDIDASTVMAREQEFLLLTILLALSSIPIVALMSWLAGNWLAAPISRLSATAQSVAGGNLSLRASVGANSQEVFELQTNFNTMTDRLQDFITNLEQRVAERTGELQKRSQELEESRSQVGAQLEQLHTIASISRNIANIQNLERLLPEVTRLISDGFDFYHVGIFLNDEGGTYTLLRASNSAGGQRMLARQHKLAIGRTGLVGMVAQSGNARIALDTGLDAVFFENPDLPDTRSEIALPLRVAGNIIGVLDVQSRQPNAFDQSDTETLSILADQIAIAIQNAQLFEETRAALNESETVYRRYIRQEWRSLLETRQIPGFEFDSSGIRPIKGNGAQKTGKPAAQQTGFPITIRGEVIGTLNVRSEGKTLDPDSLDILRATAERVALAIENSRLILESQRRATKEQTIGEISARLGASINIDNVLRTALMELGQVVPGSEIFVELEQGDNP